MRLLLGLKARLWSHPSSVWEFLVVHHCSMVTVQTMILCCLLNNDSAIACWPISTKYVDISIHKGWTVQMKCFTCCPTNNRELKVTKTSWHHTAEVNVTCPMQNIFPAHIFSFLQSKSPLQYPPRITQWSPPILLPLTILYFNSEFHFLKSNQCGKEEINDSQEKTPETDSTLNWERLKLKGLLDRHGPCFFQHSTFLGP